jgi:hypothetical protein
VRAGELGISQSEGKLIDGAGDKLKS